VFYLQEMRLGTLTFSVEPVVIHELLLQIAARPGVGSLCISIAQHSDRNGLIYSWAGASGQNIIVGSGLVAVSHLAYLSRLHPPIRVGSKDMFRKRKSTGSGASGGNLDQTRCE